MTNTPFQLITLLSEKRDLLEKLLSLLEEENRCIEELDLAGFSSAVELKVGLLDRLQGASERCRHLMKQLAAELGLPDAESLSPLLPRLEQPQQEALRSVQGQLLVSGAAFERLLAINGDLLKGALLTVTRSLDFIGGLFRRSSTYGAAGQMVGGAASARIFCKEM